MKTYDYLENVKEDVEESNKQQPRRSGTRIERYVVTFLGRQFRRYWTK